MSYRNPKIIDDKSGLILAQSLTAGMSTITKAFMLKADEQRKANALENKRLANIGFRIDQDQQADLEKLYDTKVKGAEAFTSSVRDAQAHFNTMYYDAKRSVLTDTSLTNQEIKNLRDQMIQAKSQLNKINTSIVRIGELGGDAAKMILGGNTVIGYTQAYRKIGDHKEEDTIQWGAALDNAKGTSLLMKVNDDNTISLTGSWGEGENAGSVTQSLDTINSDDYSLTEDINQVLTEGTAAAKEAMLNGNEIKQQFTHTQGFDADGNPTSTPSIMQEKVKVMENGKWNGDYTVNKYQNINSAGNAEILASVQKITSNLDVLKGEPNYMATMQNQLGINKETAKLFREGKDQNAIKAVNIAVNQQAAGQLGLIARPKVENGEITGYDFVQFTGSKVEYSPDKTMTAQKSIELYESYISDFDAAAVEGLAKDAAIADMLNIGPNRSVRIKSGYYTPVGMELNNGIVTITKTGVPNFEVKESEGGKDLDKVYYDLNTKEGIYNFIKATTPLKEKQAKDLREKILAYKTN